MFQPRFLAWWLLQLVANADKQVWCNRDGLVEVKLSTQWPKWCTCPTAGPVFSFSPGVYNTAKERCHTNKPPSNSNDMYTMIDIMYSPTHYEKLIGHELTCSKYGREQLFSLQIRTRSAVTTKNHLHIKCISLCHELALIASVICICYANW